MVSIISKDNFRIALADPSSLASILNPSFLGS